jgi:hypothetical protein
VTCITIARQRVGKHIPATQEHVKIGRLLLGNGAVNRLRQKYRLRFPLGPCKVVIGELNSEAGSCRSRESCQKRTGSGLRNWQLQEMTRRELRLCEEDVMCALK